MQYNCEFEEDREDGYHYSVEVLYNIDAVVG